MATGLVTSWGGTITDIGPMYPFVGSEKTLVIIGVVLWLIWHIYQLRIEAQDIADDLEKLKSKDVARKVVDREG